MSRGTTTHYYNLQINDTMYEYHRYTSTHIHEHYQTWYSLHSTGDTRKCTCPVIKLHMNSAYNSTTSCIHTTIHPHAHTFTLHHNTDYTLMATHANTTVPWYNYTFIQLTHQRQYAVIPRYISTHIQSHDQLIHITNEWQHTSTHMSRNTNTHDPNLQINDSMHEYHYTSAHTLARLLNTDYTWIATHVDQHAP